MVKNPLCHLDYHLLVVWNAVSPLVVGTDKALVGIHALNGVNLHATVTKILVEELQQLILADVGIRNGIDKPVDALLGSQLHGLGKLCGALACPHGLGEAIHFGSFSRGVVHKPVEQSNALGVDVRTHDGVAEGEVLVIIQLTQSLATVVEGLTIAKVMLSVAALLAREHTVGGHVDDLCVCTLSDLGKKMREVAVQESGQGMVVLGKLIEDANAVDDGIEVAFLDNGSQALGIKSVTSNGLAQER